MALTAAILCCHACNDGSPPAAHGFDEFDGGDEALGGDGIGLAFGLEAGAFGVEEFEVADGAAVVAGAGQVCGLGGGGVGR